MDFNKCPICNADAKVKNDDNKAMYVVDCNPCGGKFKISHILIDHMGDILKTEAIKTYVRKRIKNEKEIPEITTKDIPEITTKDIKKE